MLEGLQDPREVSSQPQLSARSAGAFDLDALYGSTPAATQAAPQSNDPFGLGSLSLPTSTATASFGGELPSWPAGEALHLLLLLAETAFRVLESLKSHKCQARKAFE